MITKIKKTISKYLRPLIREEINKNVCDNFYFYYQKYQFEHSSKKQLASYLESKTLNTNLVAKLISLNIPVQKEKIDLGDFHKWEKNYLDIMAFYSQLGDASIEKCLEHYLTTKYLGLKKNDVIIDLGASSSPFTDILYKHGYTNTYKQDLLFKHGIHGNQIGGNAGNMSIPANFANVMTLHCAFECFQGNSDIETIQEAERVLKNGGRLGIIPLYLDSTYFIKTGYACDRSKIDFDNKAKIVFRDDRFIEEPFSRHYSPESFFERIIKNIKKSKFKIVYFTNLEEIRCAYPDQKIYCNFLFIMTKTK